MVSKHLITCGFILAAIGCYVLGLGLPATALIVLGAGLELVFWLRLFRRRGFR